MEIDTLQVRLKKYKLKDLIRAFAQSASLSRTSERLNLPINQICLNVVDL